MQTYTECIPCFVRQAHDALRQVAKEDEELVLRTLQRVLREAAEFPLSSTPPAMAQATHRIIREESGNPDPYAEIKAESTRLALGLASEARKVISSAIDPFKMAVRFSIAGNIMDFALMANWDKLDLDNFIEQTRLQPVDDEALEKLRNAVRQARSILVLGDNAGEAVFDKLLIEHLGGADMFYAVKGSPVINDVTLEDAKASGLDEVATLVENGSDAPGTILEDCNTTFRGLFHEVGLVIAKGQANYETLSRCPRPLFFLTQVKCPVIGRDLDEPVGTWVVREHKGTKR
ncbi:hypothetical protein PDESU_05403 [Pontiella desulfatans]|uniref:Damage-control phosphatase ARMT1-like metal-binding domain-containing protein n=1 Tax=Pontiella desulfatans TaxID=2750659 RepID=A0A6C2UBJ1_PONDE|nr:ARMT1-like domain-containing protein [Pontiella desulfatans]VGO16811.1 hypothetical protein PDESU_05403 [Pontiella desulfatans]